jgi:hypothetical protein
MSAECEPLALEDLEDLCPRRRTWRIRDVRYETETFVTMGQPEERLVLFLHIHPDDIRRLDARSGTSWNLYFYGVVKDERKGVRLLGLSESDGSAGPAVRIDKYGWGTWRKEYDREFLEDAILRGPVQKTIIPRVEVVRDYAKRPVLGIVFPGWEHEPSNEELPLIASDDASLPGLREQHKDDVPSTIGWAVKAASPSEPGLQNEQGEEMLCEVSSVPAVVSDNDPKGAAEAVLPEDGVVSERPVG